MDKKRRVFLQTARRAGSEPAKHRCSRLWVSERRARYETRGRRTSRTPRESIPAACRNRLAGAPHSSHFTHATRATDGTSLARETDAVMNGFFGGELSCIPRLSLFTAETATAVSEYPPHAQAMIERAVLMAHGPDVDASGHRPGLTIWMLLAAVQGQLGATEAGVLTAISSLRMRGFLESGFGMSTTRLTEAGAVRARNITHG
jgi:hypothetical protein